MILQKKELSEKILAYFQNKPVKKVWLFGSYARDTAAEESDVDVLVDIDYDEYIGWDYYIWHNELADLLQKKVDVVSLGGVNKRVWPYIEKDMTLIYER
jgi:uncharacterized protein